MILSNNSERIFLAERITLEMSVGSEGEEGNMEESEIRSKLVEILLKRPLDDS